MAATLARLRLPIQLNAMPRSPEIPMQFSESQAVSENQAVIASGAKQSILPLRGEMDCFVASLLAMTSL